MSMPSTHPPPPQQQLARAIGYMMIMGAMWGLQISLTKIGAIHHVDPVAWTTFVTGVGASLLFLIAARRGTSQLSL
mgnify:FL=1